MTNFYTSQKLKRFNHMRQAKSQQGLVMFITLISLVIMLLSSIALIRSTDANLLVSGHLSFKRDIVNQAERTIPKIKDLFTSPGALYNNAVREGADSASIAIGTNNNYFATIQSSNAFGIPDALMNTTSTVYTTNYIIDNTATNSGITIRYMIDRMCLTAGSASPTSCSLTKSGTDPTGCQKNCPGGKPQGIDTPIYRISIRATGPRNTEAFIQSTFTVQ